MITVLQIIPSLGAGGAEQACIDIALGLKAAGHKAIVVSSGGPRVKELEDNGILHITKDVERKNPFAIWNNAKWLTQIAEEHKVDIIHARSRAPAWSGLIASHRVPCGFVTTFHAAYKFSNRFKKMYNSVMACGDRIIAISDFIAKNIRDNYDAPEDRIRIIPRGIDLDAYVPEQITEKRRELLLEVWGLKGQERPIILMPGRITPIKGQKILINAMALLKSSPHNPVAIIIGDDQGRTEYRAELDKQIAFRKVEDNVHIVSHTRDMPTAYNLATVVAAPSLVPEGFGRVPIEAMAMGVPVVASDLGGYSENIRNGETGWLIPPQDSKKLAEALLKVLDQPAEERAEMKQRAMKEIHDRYDKRKMISSTLKVYEEVIRLRFPERELPEPLPEQASPEKPPEQVSDETSAEQKSLDVSPEQVMPRESPEPEVSGEHPEPASPEGEPEPASYETPPETESSEISEQLPEESPAHEESKELPHVSSGSATPEEDPDLSEEELELKLPKSSFEIEEDDIDSDYE